MPNTEVLGDKEKGNIPELLRQAGEDSKIKKILAGIKDPEKLELDFFLKNFIKGHFAECEIGEPIIAYYASYGCGFFAAYFAGSDDPIIKLCFRKEIHPSHEDFPKENTRADYLPDSIIKLKYKGNYKSDVASPEIIKLGLVKGLPEYSLIEVESGIYGTSEFSKFIGFLERKGDNKIQLLGFKNEDSKYSFPIQIDFGERYVESVSLLEPEIKLPEDTELSDKVKKWLQLE